MTSPVTLDDIAAGVSRAIDLAEQQAAELENVQRMIYQLGVSGNVTATTEENSATWLPK